MIRVRNQIGVELLLHASVIIAKSRVRLEIQKKVRLDDARIPTWDISTSSKA
jgi:hypothetical protein